MPTEQKNPKNTFTKNWIDELMTDCTLCPRKCHVNRLNSQLGYCGQSNMLYAARAALHFWEEPCISGENGSGTVFFSGCNLKCIFCQNHTIAVGKRGFPITLEHLTEIFLELQQKGANNINLVTPTHFIPQICYSLQEAKRQGLTIPIVYNTSGYEEVTSLTYLDGLVDIYLPDFKYFSADLSKRYSYAPDYFTKASAALAEMVRQVNTPLFDTTTNLMKRGVIVRHLLLPKQTKDSKKILRYLYETYHDAIYISIMNQYTPLSHINHIPELNCKITNEEYHRVLKFADLLGISQGFMQEGDVASESFIPDFHGEGL